MVLTSVLVVDDSEADQFICDYTLKKHNPNIQISTALDGKEALELLRSEDYQPPQVIFLDINMPGMNGHEFLEKYKNQFEAAGSPIVIMLTSSEHRQDVEKSMAYDSVVDYFTKPLELNKLEEFCKVYGNLG